MGSCAAFLAVSCVNPEYDLENIQIDQVHALDNISLPIGHTRKIVLSELIENEGWHVVNVDITIAMQRPKLAPYIVPMRECLSEIMGISPARVSVKATTTEKLGFVGRSEGCEVYAVALLGREEGLFD